MSRLADDIVERLLRLSVSAKEEVGNRIARALGADPTKTATGLPTLKGNQDGGLDGRFFILREVLTVRRVFNEGQNVWKDIPGSLAKVEERLPAGLSVKLEGSSFSRMELNSFVEDLRREGITAGLIVAAKGLSDHAVAELNRHNKTAEVILVHCTVAQLLAGDIPQGILRFESDPTIQLQEALEQFLAG